MRVPRFVLHHAGDEVGLVPGKWIVGRASDAGVHIADPSVSRRHAMLRVTPSFADLLDLGSQNGTFVNGRPLSGHTRRLRGGDRIGVGKILLQFEERAVNGGDSLTDDKPTQPIDPVEVMAHVGRPEADEPTLVDPPAPPPFVTASLGRVVLALADDRWAERIRRATQAEGDLEVDLVAPHQVVDAARRPGTGVLVLDLDATTVAAEIVSLWNRCGGGDRRIVLVAGNRLEHEGRKEAARLGAQAFVRAGKPAVLVVAAIRFQLAQDPGSAGQN